MYDCSLVLLSVAVLLGLMNDPPPVKTGKQKPDANSVKLLGKREPTNDSLPSPRKSIRDPWSRLLTLIA